MSLADKLKNLTKTAEDKAAEHKDQIHQAVQKAEAAADQRTGGQYHDQIQAAGAKADGFVDGLQPPASPDTSKADPNPASPGNSSGGTPNPPCRHR